MRDRMLKKKIKKGEKERRKKKCLASYLSGRKEDFPGPIPFCCHIDLFHPKRCTRTWCTHSDGRAGPGPWNAGDASSGRTLLPSSVHQCCCRRKSWDLTAWALNFTHLVGLGTMRWLPAFFPPWCKGPGKNSFLCTYGLFKDFSDWFQKNWNALNRFHWGVFRGNFLQIQGALEKIPI